MTTSARDHHSNAKWLTILSTAKKRKNLFSLPVSQLHSARIVARSCMGEIPETNKPRAFSPIYSSTFLLGNSCNGDITFQVFLSCFLSTWYTCRIDFSPSALTIWREAPHSTSLKLSSLSLGRHFLPSLTHPPNVLWRREKKKKKKRPYQ